MPTNLQVYHIISSDEEFYRSTLPHPSWQCIQQHKVLNFYPIPVQNPFNLVTEPLTDQCYGTRRRDHITPMLRQLHWLPVRQRVEFKLAIVVYKALHDATAAYLVYDCQLVSHAGRRRLRSADIDTCCVPRTNTRLGDRSFAAAGPRLWNSLPARICQPDNDIGEFRQQLKSFLFN